MGGAMKYLLKKLLGHEIFRTMVSWTTNFFFSKIFKILRPPLLLLHTYRTLPFNARVEDSSIKDFVLSITLQV